MGNTRDRIKLKSLLALALCLTMALGLAACGQQTNTETPAETAAPVQTATPAATPEPTEEPELTPPPFPERPDEIEDAIQAGLIPARLQTDLDRQVTFQDYTAMLDALVNTVWPEKKAEWLETSATFRDSDRPITRFEGMLTLLFAAECLEIDDENFNMICMTRDVNPDADNEEDAQLPYIGAFTVIPWDVVDSRYYDETIASSDYWWRCEDSPSGSYKMNTMWFALTPSFGNGKTYFDFDENFELHPAQPLTRDAAIRAVDRLYETAKFAIVRVPYDGQRFELSDYAKAQAASMPEVSYQNLPDWHGFAVVAFSSQGPASRYFDREYIGNMIDYGFDFCLAALDMRWVFDGNDTTRVSPTELKDIDELIELCARHQVHINLRLDDMVGFYTESDRAEETLFTSEETQEEFLNIWRFFTERYRDVPSSVLSFNLINEPHDRDDNVSDEAYSALMIRAIDAIHEITPDRLLFADVIEVLDGEPVEGLAGQEVVQAIHTYPLAHTKQYPTHKINESIYRDNGAVEFRGSFPAGTELTVELLGIDVDMSVPNPKSVLSFVADGRTFGSVAFDRPAGFRDWFAYDPSILAEHTHTFTLDEPASVIRIEQIGGDWYSHNSIILRTGDYTINLLRDMSYRYVNGTPPVLTVAEDGSFTVEDPGSLYTVDLDSMREVYAKYKAFTERTGTLFMVQELGFRDTMPSSAADAMAEDYFTLFEELGMPWVTWCDTLCPVLSANDVWYTKTFFDWDVQREGGNYVQASEHYIVDTNLLEVFQRHMN